MSKIYPVKSDKSIALIIQKSKNANLSSLELLGKNYETLCQTKNWKGSSGSTQHVEHLTSDESIIGLYGCSKGFDEFCVGFIVWKTPNFD